MARNSPARIEFTLDSTRQLLDRRRREQTGLFWAEGARSFLSSFDRQWCVRGILYSPRLLKSPVVWQRLRTLPIPKIKVSPEVFSGLSRREMPDGIGVVAEQQWCRLIDQSPCVGDLWVALDSVRTPGNLGTIMRTAAACGAQGIMLVGGELDPYDPATIRASMGALFGTSLIRTSTKALEGWKARRHEVAFLGTSPSAEINYRAACFRTPLVIVMGAERSGLGERELRLCDEVVRLPMAAGVDSLNLAVATSIMLYQARGQLSSAMDS
jgi:RNA methyltransferase, TrmH family